MKTFPLITALYLAVSEVSAHYRFNSITVAGKKYGEYEGVRENSNMNSPVTGMPSPWMDQTIDCHRLGVHQLTVNRS